MDVRKQINLLAASVGIAAPVAVRPRGDHCVTASVGRYDQHGDDEASALGLLLNEVREVVRSTHMRGVAELATYERTMTRQRAYVQKMVDALDATEE